MSSTQRSLVPIVQAGIVAGTTSVAIWYQLRPLAIFFLTGLSGVVAVRSTGHLQHAAASMPPCVRRLPAAFEAHVRDPLQSLHAGQPTVFCALAVAALSGLAYVGCLVSGCGIALATLMTMLAGFVLCHVMGARACGVETAACKDAAGQQIAKRATGSSTSSAAATAVATTGAVDGDDDDDDHENDDLLPDSSPANRLLLQRAGDEASVSTRCDSTIGGGGANTDDSCGSDDDLPSDLLGPAADQMPEIDSELSSEAGDDDDDDAGVVVAAAAMHRVRPVCRLPKEPRTGVVADSTTTASTTAAGAVRSSSTSSLSSSSSSDDDSISRGLDFQSVSLLNATAANEDCSDSVAKATTTTTAATTAAASAAGLSQTVTDFLGGLMQRGVQQVVAAQVEQALGARLADALMVAPDTSSDDSDFEVLTHADCRPTATGGAGAQSASGL